jgi:hypothetical protein
MFARPARQSRYRSAAATRVISAAVIASHACPSPYGLWMRVMAAYAADWPGKRPPRLGRRDPAVEYLMSLQPQHVNGAKQSPAMASGTLAKFGLRPGKNEFKSARTTCC